MLAAVLLSFALTQASPTATEVSIPTHPGVLAGTMLDVGDGAPAALIIAGSGPTDRDGNSRLGISAPTYRLLAEGLAAEGVTTLRYDKRGVGGSAGALISEAELDFGDMVADARAWASLLRAETGQSCVWLIGHSEGSLIGQAAAVDNPDVCGLVLVSGAGRPAATILREQISATTPEPYLSQALTVLAELEAGRTVECPPLMAALCRPSLQPYIISWMAMDPVALAAAETRPILVVQGSTDIQTTVVDAQALAGARDGIELVVLEGVNHVLKVAPADRAANVATYSNPDLPLADGVVDAIARFIIQR